MTKTYEVLKLIDGSQIIGVTSSRSVTSDVVKITNPLVMYESLSDAGMMVVYFRKYTTLSAKDHISISKDSVMTHFEPDPELIKYYEVMVEYHHQIEDELKENIVSATEVISQYLRNKKEKGKDKNTNKDDIDTLTDAFTRLAASDKKHTKH